MLEPTPVVELTVKRAIGTAVFGLGLAAMTAVAQDMMRYIDLSAPEMVSAEMTRGDVERALKTTRAEAPTDFTGKRLSGLDLSGLELEIGQARDRARRHRPHANRRPRRAI